MISTRLKLLLALLVVAGLAIVARASMQNETYLPVVYNFIPSNTPTSTKTPTLTFTPKNTITDTPTPTNTHTPTPTNTVTPSPTATLTQDPIPTVQVNSMVEIEMIGPTSTGMGTPNPFLIEVEVTFTGPVGQTFVVQGFYDGDGVGGMDGSIWKVRFTADAPGEWNFLSSSQESLLNGYSGAFNAVNPSDCEQYSPGGMPDFSCLGRLEYSGDHYLSFANGQYWFKGGVNDPEDFLVPGNTVGFPTKEDAIDFLAANGINSLYMLFNNIEGDGSDLYPWVGDTPFTAKNNHERYDLAKLAEWKNVFDYLQSKGLVLHLVFEDDSAWTGFNRQLYYREMIARFGHYNGLIWNVSEEFNENYPDANEIKAFAQMIKDLDAYDHPLTVHQVGVLTTWDPFLGDTRFDLTSFQTPLLPLDQHNANAVEWFDKVEDSGRTIPVSFDEIRYFDILDTSDSRHAIWAVYMGGAIHELRINPDTDYLPFEQHMVDLHTAREFMEQLPYWQMQPMNYLLEAGQGYVFAKSGEVYSVYLPVGGQIDLNLIGTDATFDGQWFNPRNVAYQDIGAITGGSVLTFTAPSTEDWVLLLQ